MSSVLIIDDHALLTQGLRYALQAEGFEVHVATEPDAQLAVALALVHHPVLALLDLQFQTGTFEGMALVEPLARTTPVLVLTGVTDPAVLGACLEAGAAGVASKAEPFDRLFERILAVLDGGPVHSMREREDLFVASRERREERQRCSAAFASLSPREQEVLDHLARGLPAEAIAERIIISLPTVRSHIQSILRKLDVTTQLAAVARAHDAGWSLDATVNERR